jgi:putative transposase
VAHKFLLKAINNNGCPVAINTGKCGTNKQAIRTHNKRSFTKIKIRQCQYPINKLAGDHRFIDWRTLNTLGFKSFASTFRTLSGLKMVKKTKKNQVVSSMATPL